MRLREMGVEPGGGGNGERERGREGERERWVSNKENAY
jgi:hypothetical protein